jgi:hypothetical protein
MMVSDAEECTELLVQGENFGTTGKEVGGCVGEELAKLVGAGVDDRWMLRSAA